MQIVIITSDSFFSYLLISDLVKRHHGDVVSIVISPSKIKGKSTLQTVVDILKKTGWRNLMYKVIAGLWVYFAELLHKVRIIEHCITPSSLAKRYDIELFYTQDCNDEITLNYLQSKDIDILLSINVYQRMLERLLSLPKVAAVNNHFGLLPKYRGMAPYIWAMANGEKEIGLSVHHMVLAFDEGRLIRQQKLLLEANDSAMGVYIRACLVARIMITEAIEELRHNPSCGFAQEGDGSYFSMPTRECIKNLRSHGYCLWKIRDLWSVVRKRLCDEDLP